MDLILGKIGFGQSVNIRLWPGDAQKFHFFNQSKIPPGF